MKKILILILCTFFLFGCGKRKDYDLVNYQKPGGAIIPYKIDKETGQITHRFHTGYGWERYDPSKVDIQIIHSACTCYENEKEAERVTKESKKEGIRNLGTLTAILIHTKKECESKGYYWHCKPTK
tara:strand:- start:75 stop:452 length:378 start_codon:yes stop_codon:yes gene_type:complete